MGKKRDKKLISFDDVAIDMHMEEELVVSKDNKDKIKPNLIDSKEAIKIDMEIEDLDKHFGRTSEDGVDEYLLANMAGKPDAFVVNDDVKVIINDTIMNVIDSKVKLDTENNQEKLSIIMATKSVKALLSDKHMIKEGIHDINGEDIIKAVSEFIHDEKTQDRISDKIDLRLKTLKPIEDSSEVQLLTQNKIVDLETNEEKPLGKSNIDKVEEAKVIKEEIFEKNYGVKKRGIHRYVAVLENLKVPC